MNNVFLKIDGDIEGVSSKVFNALGITDILEGDSLNVLDGIYYSYSVFGTKIQLEKNSYDFEEVYNYMISISEDFVTTLAVPNDLVNSVTDIVVQLLVINLSKAQIALEKNEELIVVKPGDISDQGNVVK